MDKQSSIVDVQAGLNLMHYGSILLPTSEYSTSMVNFPGNNCIPVWDVKGNFCASVEVYAEGKHSATFHSPCVTEQGYMECNLDEIAQFVPADQGGIVITRLWHAPKVPVELYYSHAHRATGTYLSYPALPFMGDLIYLDAHSDQLENSLFWPGIFCSEQSVLWFAVINPFKLSFSFQVSLYLPDGRRVQSEVMKVQKFSCRWLNVEEVFPAHKDSLMNSRGMASLCISAQFKTLAYGVVRDRASGVISTIDHLHQYTMI